MPRKPRYAHPLRSLRETIGKTQTEFAQMLGVSKDLVQSIELWRAEMTEEVAIKVRQQTGCVPFRTTKDKSRPTQKILAFGLGEDDPEHEYTQADFDEHQQNMQDFVGLELEERALVAARCINLLVYAAAQRGGGHVLSLCHDLERFVMNACEQYGLTPNIAAVARDGALQYIGVDNNPGGSIKSFAKAPLSVASSFLISTEAREEGTQNKAKSC